MISVIIPTYNNEDTIERAVLSVLNQTYRDWELIIINDGCTDDTMKRIDMLPQFLDTRLKIITNDVNRGVGVCRQQGVDAADGEFIMFLDSDDELTPDCLQMQRHIQHQQDADVVYASVMVTFPETMCSDAIKQEFEDKLLTGKSTIDILMDDTQLKFITGKLFKRSAFDGFTFSDMRTGEDVEAMFVTMYRAERVRTTSYAGYIHHHRIGSLIGGKTMFYRYCINASVMQLVCDFFKSVNEQDIYMMLLRNAWMYHVNVSNDMDCDEFRAKPDLDDNRELWDEVVAWFKDHQSDVDAVDADVRKTLDELHSKHKDELKNTLIQ